MTPTLANGDSLGGVAMRVHPVWLVLVGILSVQFGASLAKSIFDDVSPTTIVWLRLTASAVVLAALARPRLRDRSRKDWLVVVGFGVALAVMNWSFYQSFARIPLGLAVTFEFVGPLSLAVFGSRRVRDLLWVLLAGLGVALLGVRGGDLDLVGVLFALLAAAAWASYILLSAQTGRRWEGLGGLSTASVIAALILTPPILAGRTDELGSPHVLLIGALVGLLSSVVPYGLELIALRTIAPPTFSILMSLEPAAGALAGILVLHEILAPVEWLAIACVIVASVGATRYRRTLAEPVPG